MSSQAGAHHKEDSRRPAFTRVHVCVPGGLRLYITFIVTRAVLLAAATPPPRAVPPRPPTRLRLTRTSPLLPPAITLRHSPQPLTAGMDGKQQPAPPIGEPGADGMSPVLARRRRRAAASAVMMAAASMKGAETYRMAPPPMAGEGKLKLVSAPLQQADVHEATTVMAEMLRRTLPNTCWSPYVYEPLQLSWYHSTAGRE